MSYLYEIDRNLEALIDQETGEIVDYEAFEALLIEKEAKIENTALWIKNLTAEIKMLKDEENALAKRRKKAEKRLMKLENHLTQSLNGQKRIFPRVSISWIISEKVKVDEANFISWAKAANNDLLRYKEPEPDKNAIVAGLKNGDDIPFVQIEQSLNIQIK